MKKLAIILILVSFGLFISSCKKQVTAPAAKKPDISMSFTLSPTILEIVDGNGNFLAYMQTIYVTFTVTKYVGNSMYDYVIKSNSNFWSNNYFQGQGYSGTARAATFSYVVSGNHDITLNVSTPNGSATKTITVTIPVVTSKTKTGIVNESDLKAELKLLQKVTP